jgi:tetratricopeptide (TPR) repeat protein
LTLAFGLALAVPATAQGPSEAQLFANLGGHHRTIATKSKAAQKYFDQGLNLLFGFNHDEAIRSFQAAARLDPSCPMAQWGIAYANGPHINNPGLDPDHAKAAYDAIQKALKLAPKGSVERDLIEALVQRYASDPKAERAPLDQAYADAMREVWKRHPQDADVGHLFAEAAMDLHPWDLWTTSGEPRPWTSEIVATLEAVLKLSPNHPGANHLYIHSVEASPHPERALPSAGRLADLVPGAGHLVHMPGHIYQRVGRYEDAADANRKAIAVDDAYVAKSKQQAFYLMYKSHNHQFLAWSAMMEGRASEAIGAARNMTAQIPAAMITEMAGVMDGTWSLPLFALVRFGRWDEVLREPAPDSALRASNGLWHWARGEALCAKGKLEEAFRESVALADIAAGLDDKAVVGFNSARGILGIASDLLAGDLAVALRANDEAVRRFRSAVAAEDGITYNEPSDWPFPARHWLGAALVGAGKLAEAEAVYREDLRRNPENGWALRGLATCLRQRGADAEAAEVEARFEKAWLHADVKLTASRF